MTTILKFLAAAGANLLADLSQIENLLGGFGVVSGALVAATQNTPAAKWVGVGVAFVGGLTVTIPKVAAFIKGAEGELQKLIATVEAQSKPAAK